MPNIKFRLPLMQLCTILMWPVTGCQWEEISTSSMQPDRGWRNSLCSVPRRAALPHARASRASWRSLHALHLCPLESMHRGCGCWKAARSGAILRSGLLGPMLESWWPSRKAWQQVVLQYKGEVLDTSVPAGVVSRHLDVVLARAFKGVEGTHHCWRESQWGDRVVQVGRDLPRSLVKCSCSRRLT